MALKMKKSTLADKINSLVTTAPVTFNSDDEAEDTKAKVVDHYNESDNSDINLQISEIRRRNVDPLDQVDKRYKGKKVSRKNIYNDDDNDFNSENISQSEDEKSDVMEKQSDNDDEQSFSSNDSNIEDNVSDDEMESNEDNSESDHSSKEQNNDSETDLDHNFENEDDSDVEDENNDMSLSKVERGFQTISQTNVRTDIEKGNCIRSQLNLWESLLEIRIKLQKCLTTSNQMPQPNIYKEFKTNQEYAKNANETKHKLKILLNNMLQLQSFLLKQYPETKDLSTHSKKRKAEKSIDKQLANSEDPMDEEIPSDTEDEIEEKDIVTDEDAKDFDQNMFKKKMKLNNYENVISDNHKLYAEYRNSIIQKWNEKTRIASGKLNKGGSESTLKQIEFTLNDKEKLYKRSHLKRSEYKIVGKAEDTVDNDGRRVQGYDSEIYDDDDFYHQLLRDLIEYKSSDITDPIQLSKQWIRLQNIRSKMKRKIDTRATKGRRIRYNVHNKLVNFMAPIIVNDTWTDHAKNELYNSLFGKIKYTKEEAGH